MSKSQPSFNDREYDLWKKLVGNSSSIGPVPPPVGGNFLLLDSTPFLLLDLTNFLLIIG